MNDSKLTRNKKGQFVKGHKETPVGNTRWDHPNVKAVYFKKGVLSSPKPFEKKHTPWNKGLQYGVGERLKGQIMNLSMYRNWRTEIKKRDGHKCVQCPSTEKLEIDHYPKTFRELVMENNIKNVQDARECLALWQLEAGRTLCRGCHIKTETYGGVR